MKKRILAAIAGAVMMPVVAGAADIDGYIGGSLGYARANMEPVDDLAKYVARTAGTDVEIDDTGLGFKVFGGARLHRHFAIEAYYTDLGESKGEADIAGRNLDAGQGVSGFGLSGVGILPVTERIEVFGKAGVFRWNTDVDTDYSPIEDAGLLESDDGIDAAFGVGASYRFSQFTVRGEIERFVVDDSNADLVSAGMVYHF